MCSNNPNGSLLECVPTMQIQWLAKPKRLDMIMGTKY